MFEDQNLYDDFNMDEVDMRIENYEELFDVALDNPKQLYVGDGIDGIFGMKDMSESNSQGAYAAEGSQVGGRNAMQPAFSNAASGDSIFSCKPDLSLSFARPANSGISFSGLTNESSAGDYQDCGASSPIPFMGEPPWQPSGPECSAPSSRRIDAVMRYKEKDARQGRLVLREQQKALQFPKAKCHRMRLERWEFGQENSSSCCHKLKCWRQQCSGDNRA